MDRETREWQRMCRRAEAAGYDGDIADLFDDEPERLRCLVCGAPAHHVYTDGDELAAYCSICDRIGAEDDPDDRPMESTALVVVTGALLFVALLVGLVLLPAVQR